MVFVPRWEKYKDKKPTGPVEVDWGHELSEGLIFVPDFTKAGQDSFLRSDAYIDDNILVTNGAWTSTESSGVADRLEYYNLSDVNSAIDSDFKWSALVTFRIRDRSQNANLLSRGSPSVGTKSFGLIANTSNSVSFATRTSNWYSTNSPSGSFVTDNNIRTVAVTYDGSIMKIYGDGKNIFSNNRLTSTFPSPNSRELVIANGEASQNNTSYYSTKLDTHQVLFFNRVLSETEVYLLNENPYQILKPRKTFFTFSASSSQTLTPTLFTNTNTFYSPSANTGTVSLQPSVFNNTSSFYTPTVATSNSLQADVLSNTNTFYSHTLAEGSVALQPLLFTNNNTVYSSTVIQGTVALQPALVSNENSFLSPTVSTSYTLQSGLLTNTNTFYTQQLSASYALQPTLASNTSEFYTPVVSTSYSLQADVLTNAQIFYNAIVSNEGSKVLVPERFDNTSLFYTPTLTTGTVSVQPNRFDNTETFYTTTVTSTYPLQTSLYTNTSTFNAHTVSAGTVTLQSDLFVQTNNFYSATVVLGSGTQFIQPTLFENTHAFFSGVVAIEQFIVPSLFTNTNSFNTHVIIDASLYKEIVEFNVSFKQLNETQHNIQQDNLSSSYIKQVESFQTEL